MLRSLLRLCERGFHQPLDHLPTLPGSPTSTQRKCANRGSSRRPVYLRRLPAKVVHDQSRIESLEQNAIRSDSRLPWDRRVRSRPRARVRRRTRENTVQRPEIQPYHVGGAAPEQLADGAVVAVGDPARRRRRPLHDVLEAFVGHGLPAGAPVESVEFDMRTTQPGGQRGGEGRLPAPLVPTTTTRSGAPRPASTQVMP